MTSKICLCFLFIVFIAGCDGSMSNRTSNDSIRNKPQRDLKDTVLHILDTVSRQPKEAGQESQIAASSSQTKQTYQLGSGLTAYIEGKTINIVKQDGKELSRNDKLIRNRDENEICPSEGFLRIASKGSYFTIEQQNCADWYFINEFITFKYVDEKILLYKVGLEYIDRRAPERIIPDKVLTTKNFGELLFEKVTLDSLYLVINRN